MRWWRSIATRRRRRRFVLALTFDFERLGRVEAEGVERGFLDTRAMLLHGRA